MGSHFKILVDLGLALRLIFALMAGLFESVRQALGLMVALPTTASLAEDGFALFGRGIARTWRVVTFRGRKAREE